MCFANIEPHVMASPRVQALAQQREVMESLREKFNAIPASKPIEFLEAYHNFMIAWRKFRSMVDAL